MLSGSPEIFAKSAQLNGVHSMSSDENFPAFPRICPENKSAYNFRGMNAFVLGKFVNAVT